MHTKKPFFSTSMIDHAKIVITQFNATRRFKVELSLSTKTVICLIESPLKMAKNALHFILQALFVLQIF